MINPIIGSLVPACGIWYLLVSNVGSMVLRSNEECVSWDRRILVDFVGIHDGDCRTIHEWFGICEYGLLGLSALQREGIEVVGVAARHLEDRSSIRS